MRVIFLDCDGVLNCDTTETNIPNTLYIGLDDKLLQNFKELVDKSNEVEETVIVLSAVELPKTAAELPYKYTACAKLALPVPLKLPPSIELPEPFCTKPVVYSNDEPSVVLKSPVFVIVMSLPEVLPSVIFAASTVPLITVEHPAAV